MWERGGVAGTAPSPGRRSPAAPVPAAGWEVAAGEAGWQSCPWSASGAEGCRATAIPPPVFPVFSSQQGPSPASHPGRNSPLHPGHPAHLQRLHLLPAQPLLSGGSRAGGGTAPPSAGIPPQDMGHGHHHGHCRYDCAGQVEEQGQQDPRDVVRGHRARQAPFPDFPPDRCGPQPHAG